MSSIFLAADFVLLSHLISMLFHVAECVLISIHEDELEIVKGNAGSHIQVRCKVVLRHLALENFLTRFRDTSPLQKLTSNDSYKIRIFKLVSAYVSKILIQQNALFRQNSVIVQRGECSCSEEILRTGIH